MEGEEEKSKAKETTIRSAIQELLGSAKRIEEACEIVSRLPVGGDLIHKVSNHRFVLLGEAFRMRKMAGELGGILSDKRKERGM